MATMTDGNLSDREHLSPIQNIMQYRSPSPASTSTISLSSRKSRDSSGSSDRRSGSDFTYGKFYKTSFLKEQSPGYKRGPSLNTSGSASGVNYHRPSNFSYNQNRTDFQLRKKDKDSIVVSPLVPKPKTQQSPSHGMISALSDQNYVRKKKLGEDDVMAPVSKKEAIYLSKYAGGEKPKPDVLSAIERDDWPAPPEPAVAYPELLRARKPRTGRTLNLKDSDSEHEEMDSDEDEENTRPIDPRVEKELDELRKIADHLEKKRRQAPRLDPRSASRTPAADHEPHYMTRYESPIFASPSRDLAYTPRHYSLDDNVVGRKYRTFGTPLGNYQIEKRKYESPKSLVSTLKAPRPGYGLAKPAQRGKYQLDRGYHTEGEYLTDVTDSEFDASIQRELAKYERPQQRARSSSHTSRTSASSFSETDGEIEYDARTGLRKSHGRRKVHGTQYSDGLSSLGHPDDETPIIYPFEQLRVTNPILPPGTDRNTLEKHLSKDDFETLFHMSREQFYRLPEWKRNDMKSKIELF